VPSEIRAISVNEIDLSAPENGKYRDWLAAHGERSYEQTRRLPEPSTRRKRRPDNTAFKKWVKENKLQWVFMLYRVFAEERWKTWEWNDDWNLELYDYRPGDWGWMILRAHNKRSGETQVIEEVFNDYCLEHSSPRLSLSNIVDETHLVYSLSYFDYSDLYLFALGQGSVRLNAIDYLDEWSFAWADDNTLYYFDKTENPAWFCEVTT